MNAELRFTYLHLDGQTPTIRTRLKGVSHLLHGESVRDQLGDIAQDTFGDKADYGGPGLLISERCNYIDLGDEKPVSIRSSIAGHFAPLTSLNPMAINGSSTSGFPHPT
jgi:hypothetical protein